MRNLMLNDIVESISYHSNKDEKNKPSDVDIDLYSIHKFFKNIEKGNTNMFDMIYGYSNKDAVLYDESNFSRIYNNRDKLISKNIVSNNFLGYAYGQYKKYYEKNKRLNTLKGIKEYFDRQIQYNDRELLKDYYQDMKKYLLNNIGSFVDSVVSKEKDNKLDTIFYKVNNAKFHTDLSVNKFLESINSQESKYGDRVRNNNIDYKSIYHSYRMIFVSELLAIEGDVKLPLSDIRTNFLKRVKNGNIDYKNIGLEDTISKVRNLIDKSDKLNNNIDKGFIEHTILDFYNYI